MLHKLSKTVNHTGKRHGRGIGSGKGGHTTGRGTKGSGSRSGDQSPRPGFEGGQMPLSRRIPKLKGFSRRYFTLRDGRKIIDISKLAILKDGETVTKDVLVDNGLVKSSAKEIKIIGSGELKSKLNFEGIKFSATAKTSVEKAGGSIK
jgi:large subunit ribosomal protein L15